MFSENNTDSSLKEGKDYEVVEGPLTFNKGVQLDRKKEKVIAITIPMFLFLLCSFLPEFLFSSVLKIILLQKDQMEHMIFALEIQHIARMG